MRRLKFLLTLVLVVIGVSGMAARAGAQLAVVAQKFTTFRVLSNSLLLAYDASLTKAPTPALAARIATLVKQRNTLALALGAAIEATMKTEKPNDQAGGQRLESIINQIQTLNMQVANAEMLYDPIADQAQEQAAAKATH